MSDGASGVRAEGARGRRRGRPREFDPDTALERAGAVFWSRGLAATSLDDLSSAMGMARPSIANAFGDKQALYRAALARFAAAAAAEAEARLEPEPGLREALLAFYAAALDVYLADSRALGCFVMCTAPVEAAEHPAIRDDLARVIAAIDRALAKRFRRAAADGQYEGDPAAGAQLAQAVLHSLAIRARSGASRASLRRLARRAVETLVA